MKKYVLFVIGWYFCALIFSSFAQESRIDTTGSKRLLPMTPLSIDSSLFKLPVSFGIALPKNEAFISPEKNLLQYKPIDTSPFSKELPRPKKPVLPLDLGPNLDFNINPSRWEVPLLGATTTFSPTLSYSPFDRMTLFGGIGFTQYHNLSYVQNMIAPDWPVKSNITTQAFGGFAYALHERLTLHGSFQHSLYNQMPSNLIMFAPAYNTMRLGADIDVWNGLGVSVDRVWEIDKSGRMRQYMQYSPYINFGKFMKFLRGY